MATWPCRASGCSLWITPRPAPDFALRSFGLRRFHLSACRERSISGQGCPGGRNRQAYCAASLPEWRKYIAIPRQVYALFAVVLAGRRLAGRIGARNAVGVAVGRISAAVGLRNLRQHDQALFGLRRLVQRSGRERYRRQQK